MVIEYSSSDTITESEVIELYEANAWSSAKKPKVLMEALRGSHTLVTARHGSKLVGLGNAISDGHWWSTIRTFLFIPATKEKESAEK